MSISNREKKCLVISCGGDLSCLKVAEQVDLGIINVPDQAARLQGLLSGSLDVAMNLAPEERTVIKAAGGRLISYANPNVSYLQFVTAKESPLTDVRVRRALNYAVNKQLILDVLFEGAEPASGIDKIQ